MLTLYNVTTYKRTVQLFAESPELAVQIFGNAIAEEDETDFFAISVNPVSQSGYIFLDH